MVRAAVWTASLFAVGSGIAHFFPGPWTEPLVLIALGAALLVLSGRGGDVRRRELAAPTDEAVAPARGVR